MISIFENFKRKPSNVILLIIKEKNLHIISGRSMCSPTTLINVGVQRCHVWESCSSECDVYISLLQNDAFRQEYIAMTTVYPPENISFTSGGVHGLAICDTERRGSTCIPWPHGNNNYWCHKNIVEHELAIIFMHVPTRLKKNIIFLQGISFCVIMSFCSIDPVTA